MKLTSIYVTGLLEHIAQERGQIVVRMNNCNEKAKVYEGGEMECACEKKIFGEFPQKNIKLSHSLPLFAEGDKVRLTSFFDKNDSFTLENLTLNQMCGLEEAFPKTCDSDKGELFSVDVEGTLEHIAWNKKSVALRIKCSIRKYDFFADNGHESNKTEAFKKEVCLEVKREDLSLDIGIETLSAFKKGDKVRLSRQVDTGSFDLYNLTLGVYLAKSDYKSAWTL